MASHKKRSAVSLSEEIIYSSIYLIRKHKVILGFDLASLYEVEPKALNQAVKRNIERFPKDFMFQLSKQEWNSLRSQFVTLDGRGS
jgi:ORF6N domain